MIVLFLLIAAVFVALHWYVWRRLVRDTTARGSVPRRIGTVAFVVLPALTLLAVRDDLPGIPFRLEGIVDWPGFLWLAVFLYLVLALVVGEAVRPLLRRVLARRDAEPVAAPPGTGPDPAVADDTPAPALLARRVFVSRVVGRARRGRAPRAPSATAPHSVLRGPQSSGSPCRWPSCRAARTASASPWSATSTSGPILGRGFTQRVVDTINRTQPDLVAVVGDLVDGSVEDLGPAAEPLAPAARPARLVLRHRQPRVLLGTRRNGSTHVRELGVHPLENAAASCPASTSPASTTSPARARARAPTSRKALGDRDTSRAAVLLAHQPVVIHEAVDHGVDLQLSGHTHGGQLWPGNLPRRAWPTRPSPAWSATATPSSTSRRGAGAWGPPVRVGAPSDVTVVELASRQA